jgi:hypothetical protein
MKKAADAAGINYQRGGKMKYVFCLACIFVVLTGCQQSATVTYSTGDSDWCSAGSKWSMDGEHANADMVIQGIATSGKYAGYCHVVYDMKTSQGDVHIDYYFNEEGAGYQVMEINGQRTETAWEG